MKSVGRFVKYGVVSLGLTALISCAKSSGNDDGQPSTHKAGAKGFKSPPSEAGAADLYSPITEPGVPVGMGFGIDLNNHKGIPNICLDGTLETIPQQEGYISLDAQFTREEFEQALGVSTGGSASFFGFGGSARADYAQKTKSSKYSLEYVMFAFNKHHSKVFVPTGRKEAWKSSSKEEWLTSCGAGYVAAQDFGSMLFIKFSLKLDSNSSTTDWSGGASGNYMSIAKLRSDISRHTGTSGASGTLSVSALQIGGKPEELGKILKTASEAGLVESFALCNVKNTDECLKGLRSIEAYAADVFPKQMEDEKKGGPALLTTYPFQYPKTMGADFNPGLDEYVLKARKTLSSLYEDEMNDIITISSYASKDDKEAAATLIKATGNVAEIRTAGELCYKTATYQQCAARAEELRIACAQTTVPQDLGPNKPDTDNKGNDSGE